MHWAYVKSNNREKDKCFCTAYSDVPDPLCYVCNGTGVDKSNDKKVLQEEGNKDERD